MTRENKMTSMEHELWKRFFRNIITFKKVINRANEIRDKIEEEDSIEYAEEIFNTMKKLDDINIVQINIMSRLVRMNPEFSWN